MKHALTSSLEVLGAAAIVVGVALISVPAAFIIGGAALIGISFLVVRR